MNNNNLKENPFLKMGKIEGANVQYENNKNINPFSGEVMKSEDANQSIQDATVHSDKQSFVDKSLTEKIGEVIDAKIALPSQIDVTYYNEVDNFIPDSSLYEPAFYEPETINNIYSSKLVDTNPEIQSNTFTTITTQHTNKINNNTNLNINHQNNPFANNNVMQNTVVFNTQPQAKKTLQDYLEEHIDGLDVFMSEYYEPFVTLSMGGKNTTVRIDSIHFKDYITLYAKNILKNKISRRMWNELVEYAATQARTKANRKPTKVYNRFAFENNELFWDLSRSDGSLIHADKHGWSIVKNVPVKFSPRKDHLSLPLPLENGDVLDLLPFINSNNIGDKIIIVVWIVVAMITDIPRALLCLSGTQGSAKTTLANMLKSLCDPSSYGSAHIGKKEDDFILILQTMALPFFDNLTKVPDNIQEILCKCTTGGGFARRKLYTDDELIGARILSPIIMTGINVPIYHEDLIDRTLSVELIRISSSERKTEKELYRDFESVKPSILGGMLNVLVHAIDAYDNMQEHVLTLRMADFMKWGVCVAEAIGKLSTNHEAKHFTATAFQNATQEALRHGYSSAVADNRFLNALIEFLESQATNGFPKIEVTTRQFYDEFNKYAMSTTNVQDYMPKTLQHFSKELKNNISSLEYYAWKTTIYRGAGNTSNVLFEKI